MSASKRKGTAAETAVVGWLRDRGWFAAERRALQGTADRGDVSGIPGVVLEIKNRRVIDLASFVDEANAEARNDDSDIGVALVKRRGRTNPGDWYAVMDGATLARLLKRAGY